MHARTVMTRLIGVLVLIAAMWGVAAAQMPQPQSLETSPLAIETAAGKRFDFTVQLALTPEQKTIGLMFVEEMPADEGMLFVYDDDAQRSFWMRNTLIPLDIIFLTADGTIINIVERAAPLTLEGRPSEGPARAVLELNGGITRFLSIRPGDRVIHPLLDP